MNDLIAFLAQQPLLLLAISAILVSVLGGMLLGVAPWLGRFLRGVGNLGLVAALLLTVAQAARMSSTSDVALTWAGMQKQEVSGDTTRIPLSPDGHFWINAQVNGEPRRFLVDTGATLTAISSNTALTAGIEPGPMDRSLILQTANGAVAAQTAVIDELRFGNIVARDLDAVITPGMGETNVIGMNLLSRLAGWRVEGRTLILTPKNPQVLGE
ncbi:retropepsin-like aspartic protease family protein [Novosphingobium sp. NPDC080210]|uniref:retropepsin-like aspartic protease family protein n=1 Tax=Novosphingobium sp. NPDC080210 TaxID=3390596 RepID=UPI003D06A12B